MAKHNLQIHIDRESLFNRLALLIVELESFDDMDRNRILARDEMLDLAKQIGEHCDGIRQRCLSVAIAKESE